MGIENEPLYLEITTTEYAELLRRSAMVDMILTHYDTEKVLAVVEACRRICEDRKEKTKC